MIWTIIAIAVSGLGAAGIALLLRKVSGNRLPMWIVPVFAGVGMLAYQISWEYSWYEHQVQRQPAGSIVVATEQNPMIWRPWTFHFPMTTAFTVLDSRQIIRHQVNDDRVAEFILYRFEKQHVDRVTPSAYLLNCDSQELIPLSAEKQPLLDKMKRLDTTDALYRQICQP